MLIMKRGKLPLCRNPYVDIRWQVVRLIADNQRALPEPIRRSRSLCGVNYRASAHGCKFVDVRGEGGAEVPVVLSWFAIEEAPPCAVDGEAAVLGASGCER
jgi:hypothetical protein